MPPIPVLVALADATRCQIVTILREGPKPVHVVASGFGISRPAISRHLRVLKQAGLISEDKKGRENLYRLHPEALVPVQTWVSPFLSAASAVVAAPVVVKAAKVAKPKPKPASVVAAKPEPKAEAKPKAKKPMPMPEPVPASQMGFDF